MSCGRVRDWLHRDVATLDDAARLQLDDHLATCARCRDQREHLRRVRQLGESLAVPPPGAREYNRAIARALLEGSPRAAAPARPRAWIPIAAFAAVIAAGLVAFLVLRDRGAAPADRRAAAPGARDHDGSSGSRHAPERPPEDIVRPPDVVDVPTGVVAGAGAVLRWLPGERTIILEHGAVDIDASASGVARVAAPHFAAELHDADVTVEPAAVRVRRGQVTIFASSSETVLARLEAGETWTLPDPARPPRTHAGARTPPTVAELMALARRQFAARQYAEAARTTEDALALSPRRSDEAEARIFLGDIAQATGDLALASRRYGAVADAFAGEPAAESALYAAARIELRRGRTTVARTLLVRYLDRHPAGRYADDVRRELDALPPPP